MKPEIPGYLIQRELGKGGMGIVYLATRQADGKQVALKTLPPNLVTPTSARRFQREGRSLQSLDHPNIVKVFDVNAHQGNHFIAMEFVDGPPLSKLLRQHPNGLDLDTATLYGVQIARALSVLHLRGMTHRDLKPGNVMVTSDGIRLLDFGLVQVEGLTMLTATGNIVGTPRYMSPEQCAGKPLDLRSDIYSFGILLYELLIGKAPFQSESVYDLLEMQKSEPAPSLCAIRRDVPADLEQIVLHCLEKNVDDRPQRLEDIFSVLEKYHSQAADEVVSAGPSDCSEPSPKLTRAPRERAKKTSKDNKSPILALSVCFLALLSIAGLTLLSKPEHLKLAKSWLKRPFAHADSDENSGEKLRNHVQDKFAKLVEAQELADVAAIDHKKGRFKLAFNRFLDAHKLYPESPKYLIPLIQIADELGCQKTLYPYVQQYLAIPGAKDPDLKISSWRDKQSW